MGQGQPGGMVSRQIDTCRAIATRSLPLSVSVEMSFTELSGMKCYYMSTHPALLSRNLSG